MMNFVVSFSLSWQSIIFVNKHYMECTIFLLTSLIASVDCSTCTKQIDGIKCTTPYCICWLLQMSFDSYRPSPCKWGLICMQWYHYLAFWTWLLSLTPYIFLCILISFILFNNPNFIESIRLYNIFLVHHKIKSHVQQPKKHEWIYLIGIK